MQNIPLTDRVIESILSRPQRSAMKPSIIRDMDAMAKMIVVMEAARAGEAPTYWA